MSEKFTAHAGYTISNSIGIEIMLHPSGDSLKARYTDSNGKEEISEWLEIEYIEDEENSEESKPIAIWDQMEIPLNECYKI